MAEYSYETEMVNLLGFVQTNNGKNGDNRADGDAYIQKTKQLFELKQTCSKGGYFVLFTDRGGKLIKQRGRLNKYLRRPWILRHKTNNFDRWYLIGTKRQRARLLQAAYKELQMLIDYHEEYQIPQENLTFRKKSITITPTMLRDIGVKSMTLEECKNTAHTQTRWR